MVYVVDLDDTLVLTKNLNNDAYNFALEKNGKSRIKTNKRLTRESLGETPSKKLITDKQNYFTQKWLKYIVQALENGIFSNTTKQRLDELENQKEELEKQIFEEQSNNPFLTKDQILYALYNFRKINADTKEGKQLLIDSFVNAIYLYDDKFVIAFNYKNKSKTVTFEEIESSRFTQEASPKNRNTLNRVCFLFAIQGIAEPKWVRSTSVGQQTPRKPTFAFPLTRGRNP